jgi:hypothetical protein
MQTEFYKTNSHYEQLYVKQYKFQGTKTKMLAPVFIFLALVTVEFGQGNDWSWEKSKADQMQRLQVHWCWTKS